MIEIFKIFNIFNDYFLYLNYNLSMIFDMFFKKKEKIVEELTKEGDKLVFNHCYIEYPSPIFQRKPYISLNGRYKFEENKSNLIPSIYSKNVLVPFPIESLLSNVHEPVKRNSIYHYHLDFMYPTVGKDNKEIVFNGELVFLNIVRIIGEFNIHFNGKLLYSGVDEFNIKCEIQNELVKGTNSLDISIVPTHDDFNGVVGNVYLNSANKNYIKSIKIKSNLDELALYISIDTDNPNGVFKMISPNGMSSEYTFTTNNFKIIPDDFILYDLDNPFFYQYEVITTSDKINGIFIISNISVGEDKNIPCIKLNNKPIPIKGILDNYYYTDGLITAASHDQISNVISEIKRYGFNSINIQERLEQPFYYYNSMISGLLNVTNIKYESKEDLIKKIDYIRSFDSIFLVIIDLNNKNISIEDIYSLAKSGLDDKLVVVKDKNKSYGDIDIFDYIPKKTNKPYIITNLKFDSGSSTDYIDFINNKYIYLAMNGMVGHFYSSLNHPNDGILSPNYSKRAHKSKELLER